MPFSARPPDEASQPKEPLPAGPPPKAPGGEPGARPRRLKLVLFSVLTVAGILFVAELVLRVMIPESRVLETRVYAGLAGDLAPGREAPVSAEWRVRGAREDRNDIPEGLRFVMTSTGEGLRSPSRRVEDPRLRVLCLGDSSMMGYLVPDWETFPAQWAARLRGGVGPWVEFLNAAAIGYTIDDELAYLTTKGLDQKPDLVVLEVFPNDVLEKDVRKGETLREALRVRWPFSGVGRKLEGSGLVRAGRALAMRWISSPVPAEPVERVVEILEPGRNHGMFDAYEKALLELDGLCARNGIPLVILLMPHHYQVYPWGSHAGSDEYQRRMLSMRSRTHARWVDLLPAFREAVRQQPDLYVTNGMYDTHPSGTGQGLKLDAAWPMLTEEMEKLGAVDAERLWTRGGDRPSSPAGPSFRWGRTWTGVDDAPGIEVRPPARQALPVVTLPAATEFHCEVVGGPHADQCQVWVLVEDGSTTRVAELPIVGPGEVRSFAQLVTAGTYAPVTVTLLSAWAEGFDPGEAALAPQPPVVLRRPVFLPSRPKEPGGPVEGGKPG